MAPGPPRHRRLPHLGLPPGRRSPPEPLPSAPAGRCRGAPSPLPGSRARLSRFPPPRSSPLCWPRPPGLWELRGAARTAPARRGHRRLAAAGPRPSGHEGLGDGGEPGRGTGLSWLRWRLLRGEGFWGVPGWVARRVVPRRAPRCVPPDPDPTGTGPKREPRAGARLAALLARRRGRLARGGRRGKSARPCLLLRAQTLPRYLRRGCGAVCWGRHPSLGVAGGFRPASPAPRLLRFQPRSVQVSASRGSSAGVRTPVRKRVPAEFSHKPSPLYCMHI